MAQHPAFDWIDQPLVLGLFVNGQLAAVSAFIYFGAGAQIADIGVLTHPVFRKQGYGRIISGAIAERGIEFGKIIQYESPAFNTRPIAIARSLGFQQYAFMQRLIFDDSPETVNTGSAAS